MQKCPELQTLNYLLWADRGLPVEEGNILLSEGSVHSVNKSFWWYLKENKSGDKPEDISSASDCERQGTSIYKRDCWRNRWTDASSSVSLNLNYHEEWNIPEANQISS